MSLIPENKQTPIPGGYHDPVAAQFYHVNGVLYAVMGQDGTVRIHIYQEVATNTSVIALLGISVLGSTVTVPNGTSIQVLVKGN